MRALWVFLLCFALTFQGGAAVHALEMPCPMEHTGSPAPAVDEVAPALGDCCNDAQTAAQTGKLCKADTPCSSPGLCALVSLHGPMLWGNLSERRPDLAARVAAWTPPGVWRPPSLG